MKKIQNFFLMGTVALTGMAGLTACSSDSEPLDGNQPGVAGQTVKTQFALNIPYGESTRMTAGNTQQTGSYKDFLGIQNLQLLAFNEQPDANKSATASIVIGSGDNAYHKDAWRSVYRDVEIPVGTTKFVLYGMASRNGATSGQEDAERGNLSLIDAYNTEKSLNNIKFGLKPIASSADFTSSNETNADANNIINALNKVVKTEVVYEAKKSDIQPTSKTVKWSDIEQCTDEDAENYGTPLASERQTLKARYDNMVSLKSGSAASVKALLGGLKSFFGDESAIPESKKLTKEIIKNASDALTALDKNTFPQNLGLPDGVANISWNEQTFAYAAANSAAIGGNNIDYTKITYPATLAYFISSDAMSSNKELSGVDGLPEYKAWCNGTATWGNEFTKAPVSASTRSVALEKALQYGVANLKLTIKCGSATLEDNATTFGKEKTGEIPTNGGFKVTGILVGGQPGQVGWNMEATSTNDDVFKYTVYDTKMNVDQNNEFLAKYSTSTPEQCNYTLLLDNNGCSTKGKVYVTVELMNNQQDFYGKDGLVPKGGKFYLVAELNLNAASGVTNTTESRDRIFEKDYTTVANLTIGSLKNAYNCIPDLRSSKISLGLAVDLKWQTGVQFDVTID